MKIKTMQNPFLVHGGIIVILMYPQNFKSIALIGSALRCYESAAQDTIF